MATNTNIGLIPSSTTPLADGSGKITNPWYFWLKSVSQNSGGGGGGSGNYVIDGSLNTYGQSTIFQGSSAPAGATGDIFFNPSNGSIYCNVGGSYNLMSPAFTGDVTKPVFSTVLTLSNTGVVPGSYTAATVTVNSQGRITSIANGTGSTPAGSTGDVQFNGGTNFSADTGIFTYDISSHTLNLDNLDLTGTIALSGSTGTNGQVLTSNGSGVPTWELPVANITLVGDVTGSGTGTIDTTLATVNSAPGTFGSNNQIPITTVNSKGLVTAVTTVYLDPSTRDLVDADEVLIILPRHQYLITGLMEIIGEIQNSGVLAIL